MKISIQDVEYVAKLARLELTEAEKDEYTSQLNSILGYMEMLNKLDTTNVVPTAHVLPIHNVFREDIVRPSMDREEILQNAPDQENGCFRVPKVL